MQKNTMVIRRQVGVIRRRMEFDITKYPSSVKGSPNILVIGDICTDLYQYGTVDRISPEAPVPIFNFFYEEEKDGMAGNVCCNLQALGCNVKLYSGERSRKTRIIDTRSKQHLLRIDMDRVVSPLSYSNIVPHDLEVSDGIVISDYGKGFISYEFITQLMENYRKPIFIDTKKTDIQQFEGCHVKINGLEFTRLESQCSGLIVTLGMYGAKYRGVVYPPTVVEVLDVCGAGDTFLAAYAYEFLRTGDEVAAIRFSNRAAGVTVQHIGVYAPTFEELQ